MGDLLAPADDLIEPSGVGLETPIATQCGECSGGCSLVVRVVDGCAVGIRGNPFDPISRGHICPRGLALLQQLYNPDRLTQPLKRVGHRGENQWAAISWDEALGQLSRKLDDLRAAGAAHQVALLAANTQSLDLEIAERFILAYGSPNFIHQPSGDVVQAAQRYVYGNTDAIGYDLEKCNYIICFGDLLATGAAPVWAQGAFGYLRQGRAGARAKIVAVGSRINDTAANADEWVSLRPGSEGALALGLAYSIIEQELFDRDFVEKFTFGFRQWEQNGKRYSGFREFVLTNYPPRRVSEITGVPIHIIAKLAVEFARNRPALAIGWYRSAETTNAVYNLMAIESLNALVGSVDTPGGVLRLQKAPLQAWSPLTRDELAAKSAGHPRLDRLSTAMPTPSSGNSQAFLENLAGREPYPVEVLITCDANPLHSEWGGSGYNRGYDRIPLIVSISPFLDDTAQFADLLLPANVDLESWGYSDVVAGTSIPALLGFQQPVVAPAHNSLQPADIFLRLARLQGGAALEALPWEDARAALLHRLDGIPKSSQGSIFSSSVDKDWYRSLARRGWRTPGFSGREDFRRQIADKGGWWNPLYDFGVWKRRFDTPSGKLEFASLTLLESFHQAFVGSQDTLDAARDRLQLDAHQEELTLPHYEPPEFDGEEARYPLIFIPFYTAGLGEGEAANQPLMMEFNEQLGVSAWNNSLEMHPDTARSIGVLDDMEALVESPHGRLHCRVRTNIAGRPDVVCIALGLGHQGFGRFADGVGVNPKQLLTKKFDRIGGGAALVVTRVRVTKA